MVLIQWGWEQAPETYDGRAKILNSLSNQIPPQDQLIHSLLYPTIKEAALFFGVSPHVYQKWLQSSNLPSTRKEIDEYLLVSKLEQESPPKTMICSQKNIDPIPLRSELEKSLVECSSLKEGAAYMHTSRQMYLRWLCAVGLPFTAKDIDDYLEQNGYNRRHNVKKPPRNELATLIRNTSFYAIGKMFGVSDNSVRKWCKTYHLPFSSSVIKQIPDAEWEYAVQHWDAIKEKYENKD